MTFPSGTLGGWVSTPPVAVTTDSQTGTLTAPVGATYAFGKVTNSTPWTVTVLGLLGSQTLQPYTYDLVPVMPPNGLIYAVANPLGGPSSSPSGQPCYLQADWWTGSATPPGAYPGPLTAQAVAAAIAGTVVAEYQETLLATVPAGTASSGPLSLPTGTVALVVMTPGEDISVDDVLSAEGTTTGMLYTPWVFTNSYQRFVIPVDNAIDSDVTVGFSTAPTVTWYVAAITAPYVSAVVDVADQQSGAGIQPIATVIAGENPSSLVQIVAVDSSGRLQVVGVAAAGSPAAGNPVLVAGSDGTDARTLATDTSGRLVLPPASGVASVAQVINATASGSVQFGPATAQTALWVCLSVGLEGTGAPSALTVTVRAARRQARSSPSSPWLLDRAATRASRRAWATPSEAAASRSRPRRAVTSSSPGRTRLHRLRPSASRTLPSVMGRRRRRGGAACLGRGCPGNRGSSAVSNARAAACAGVLASV